MYSVWTGKGHLKKKSISYYDGNNNVVALNHILVENDKDVDVGLGDGVLEDSYHVCKEVTKS